ncbi:hypothetical protein [Sediminitomix flava]|nr:hypothetical protein [Sediminitomix flava]
MNYQIAEVKREALSIPEIPKTWRAIPELEEYSYIQFWVNNQEEHIPRYNLKYVLVHYDSVIFEHDRYLLEETDSSNIELVIGHKIDLNTNRLNSSFSMISEYPRLEDSNYYNWNEEIKIVRKLEVKEAINFLDSIGINY